MNSKIFLFYFALSLAIHVLLFNWLVKINTRHHPLLQTPTPTLSVNLLPASKKTKKNANAQLNLKKIKHQLNKPPSSLLKQGSSNTRDAVPSTPPKVYEGEIESHNIQTNTRAKQISELPDSSASASMRKKGLANTPKTDQQKLQEGIAQSAKPNCKNAYSQMGLLAAPMLLLDSVRENGCTW